MCVCTCVYMRMCVCVHVYACLFCHFIGVQLTCNVIPVSGLQCNHSIVTYFFTHGKVVATIGLLNTCHSRSHETHSSCDETVRLTPAATSPRAARADGLWSRAARHVCFSGKRCRCEDLGELRSQRQQPGRVPVDGRVSVPADRPCRVPGTPVAWTRTAGQGLGGAVDRRLLLRPQAPGCFRATEGPARQSCWLCRLEGCRGHRGA